jgi:hypothetical protein
MARATLVAVLLLAGALTAGCITSGPDGPEGPDLVPEAEEEAVGKTYRLPLTGTTWDHTTLTVLIVPPLYGQLGDLDQVNPYDGIFLRAIEDGIQHWQETIIEHGSEEVQTIRFDVYVLGRDIFVPDALGPIVDILVVNPLKPPAAAPFSGFAAGLPEGRCLVYNSIQPTDSYDWIFALSGHEFGHCLGMGHPDDHDPWQDLMSYTDIYIPDGETMPPLECVSNMNLVAVHEAFAPAFGRVAQGPIVFPARDYVIYECWERFHPDYQG